MNRIYDVVLNMNSLNSKPNAVDGRCLSRLNFLDVLDMMKQQKEVLLKARELESLVVNQSQ